MKRSFYFTAIILLFVYLMWYLLRRATLFSLPHDESGSPDLAVVPVWDILFSPDQFQTANNHILHTLLMKMSVQLFGYREWAIRLPNVLAFVLYFAAGLRLMHLISSRAVIRFTGMVLLCSVPYLMDFFSLARGYGMANALGMAAFVALAEYGFVRRQRLLWIGFTCAALAAYANFTWLNLYLALWAVLAATDLLVQHDAPLLHRSRLLVHAPPLAIAAGLAWLSYKPIRILRTRDEFKWGADQWDASFSGLLNDLLYNQPLLFLSAEQSRSLLQVLFSGGITALLRVALAVLLKKKPTSLPSAKATFTAAATLVVLVGGIVLQRHWLNTYYIDGRKATLYIPLLLAVTVTALAWLSEKHRNGGSIVAGLAVVVAAAHWFASINFYSCREWWYDANSKEVAFRLAAAPEGQRTIAVNWEFAPSLQFYNQHHLGNKLTILRTNETPQPPEATFYYVMGDAIRNVPPVYRPVKRYFWDRFLLQKDLATYHQELQAAQEETTGTDAAQTLEEKRRNLNWSGLFWQE